MGVAFINFYQSLELFLVKGFFLILVNFSPFTFGRGYPSGLGSAAAGATGPIGFSLPGE